MHTWSYTPTHRGFDSFYGYYNAVEDYFTHSTATLYLEDNLLAIAHGLDFRKNKDPITDKFGKYNTNLFTGAIQEAIENHDASGGPFFVYGAYETVHSPLEVPIRYLQNSASIPSGNRKKLCGMMQALDEGIENITKTLSSKGYLNNTVIIFSTDNGGQTTKGSSNWPLRGNKGTLFEGGVRGFAFVWGNMLSKNNFDYSGLMHISDWYLTLVEGIAGLKLGDDVTKELDGKNMWQAITQDGQSERSDILLQLNPPSTNPPFIGQAAFRSGDWKLITGESACNPNQGIPCPTGWVHLNGTIEPPPNNPNNVWLFNVTADPTERNDVATMHPLVVAQLKECIEVYNSTHIPQLNLPFDPKADPKNFEGIWTPWLTEN